MDNKHHAVRRTIVPDCAMCGERAERRQPKSEGDGLIALKPAQRPEPVGKRTLPHITPSGEFYAAFADKSGKEKQRKNSFFVILSGVSETNVVEESFTSSGKWFQYSNRFFDFAFGFAQNDIEGCWRLFHSE